MSFPGSLQKLRLGPKRLFLRLGAFLRARLGLERTTYVERRVDEYRRYWEDAAAALSARFEPLTDSIWEVTTNSARTRIAHYVTEFDDPVTLRIAGDKALVYEMAVDSGVPVPSHVLCRRSDIDRALAFLREQNAPCVVKPARNTSSGRGITTRVAGRGQMEWALARASLFCRDILVESLVPGESYRLLFLEGELIHAVRRRGTRVEGDGRRSVGELVSDGCLEVGTGEADDILHALLARQGLDEETVPRAGRSVLIRSLPPHEARARELRTVYDEDVTSLVAPALADEVEPLVSRVGASFCGVDLITTDPTRKLRESGGAFIEINTTPGIHHHYVDRKDTSKAESPDVAEAVLRRLLARRLHPLPSEEIQPLARSDSDDSIRP